MRNNCLIISVESRKGGVGKTTAALNLARILLEKRKYAVLFLDADITGTNVLDFLDSPFWKDTCHAVQNTTGDPPCTNLLDLFERQFMPGLNMPRFFNKEKTINRQQGDSLLRMDLKKINIIGSQIYDLEGSLNKSNDTLICKPSIIFDELHAFWFIEFLQKLCEAFLETIREDHADCPVAIIVDNSPGYVGIAPAVQEWLTDLGPDKGKFLIVSSLDKQDLLSCGRAIYNLHRLYERKWKTSRKFFTAIRQEGDSDTEFRLNPEEENFFLRLVEAHPRCNISGDSNGNNCSVNGVDLPFYCPGNVKTGFAYLNRPERYQGLVINRVPRLVKRGVYVYDIEQMCDSINSEGNDPFQCLLKQGRSSYSDWMVSYDEYIQYQFLQPMISQRVGQRSGSKWRIKEFMHNIGERHPIPHDKVLQDILSQEKAFNARALNNVLIYILNVHEVVEAVIHRVEEYGFFHLTHLISEEWLPGNILRDLRITIQDILLGMGFPFVEQNLWDSGSDRIDPKDWKFAERLHPNKMLNIFEGRFLEPNETMKQFLPSLRAVVILSLNHRWWHSPLGEKLPELLVAIAGIEASQWKKQIMRSRKRFSIQRFLASEGFADREWKEFRHELDNHPHLLEIEDFPRIYRACASAQARLIDVREDAKFLITLIQHLVMEDIRKTSVLPYIRSVAEDVIVRKTLSHELGQKAIVEGFSNAQYMEEFSEVLEEILKRWENS